MKVYRKAQNQYELHKRRLKLKRVILLRRPSSSSEEGFAVSIVEIDLGPVSSSSSSGDCGGSEDDPDPGSAAIDGRRSSDDVRDSGMPSWWPAPLRQSFPSSCCCRCRYCVAPPSLATLYHLSASSRSTGTPWPTLCRDCSWQQCSLGLRRAGTAWPPRPGSFLHRCRTRRRCRERVPPIRHGVVSTVVTRVSACDDHKR